SPLNRSIARIRRLLADGNGVQVRGIGTIGQRRTRSTRMIDHALEEIVRALRAMDAKYRIDGLEPLLSFLGIQVVFGRPERRQRSCGRHDVSSTLRVDSRP